MENKFGKVGLLGLIMWVGVAGSVQAFTYPLKMAGSGKNQYLTDQNGTPFMINGDTSWSLIAQATEAEAQAYFDDRAAKGFNVVLINLIEHKFASNAPNTIDGIAPFSKKGDFTTPNEAYFAHADRIIRMAANDGIVVLLAPTYLGYGCGDEGWCSEIKAGGTSMMTSWGQYVGNRYKDFPNIIWLIGADTDPVQNGVADYLRAFVTAVRAVDSNHLFTAHNAPEESALDVWNNSTKDTWLNLNDLYTYSSSYQMAANQYAKTNFKPFYLLETAYENEHSSTTVDNHSQAYWAVLSGGLLGHIFGNCPIWNAGSDSSWCDKSGLNWKTQWQSAGSKTMPLVGKLFMSRPFYKLVPDQSVIKSSNSQGSGYMMSARANDGTFVVLYTPTNKAVTVDMTKISGSSVKVWWFNPTTGAASLSGTFANTGTQAFTPSGSGDWVLVMDDAAQNFSAPGGGSVVQAKPGDANNDGAVDGLDYVIWLNYYGSTTATGPVQGDFNNDKKTDGLDYVVWLNSYGS
jgi:hypothetical protein